MRYLPQEATIALTDRAWFDYLSARASVAPLDEVNFWFPKAQKLWKHMPVGEPVFFRLKKPYYTVVGYGFYAHFEVLDLDLAWQTFGDKNGDAKREGFFKRIGGYRKVDLLSPMAQRTPLGCMVLRDPVFWPPDRWIPWSPEERGWPPNVVQGATDRDPTNVAVLMAAIRNDQAEPPAELSRQPFQLLTEDERSWRYAAEAAREGQGTFKLRLLKAYGRCAITGEHTPIVLDGAHIQRYLGPRSNHPQNGILLTKEFHALFDAGYVTITPDLQVRVSDRLRRDFKNGHRYYPYDDRPLVSVPNDRNLAPSRDALAWHMSNVFKAA
jgi:putative restriction endonuclease